MARRLVLVLLALTGWPAAGLAGEPQQASPRFEVGAHAGVFAAIGEGVFLAFAGGPRLSVNITDRLGVDFVGEILVGPNESDTLNGLYQIQLRTVVREAGPRRGAIFVTAGTAGSFSYYRFRERQERRPDGSLVIYPASSDVAVDKPIALSGGIGVQRAIARYAAFRLEAQALIAFPGVVVPRASLSISIPVGGHYARVP